MNDILGTKKAYTICNKCGQIRAHRFQSDYCDFTEHQSTNPSDRKGTERENLLRFSETRKL